MSVSIDQNLWVTPDIGGEAPFKVSVVATAREADANGMDITDRCLETLFLNGESI